MKLADSVLKRLTGMEPFPQPPLVKTRFPVVLMHGFGMMASLRRGGHLHEEALHLRAHGVWAYAPNVVPYNTVEVRSAMWKQRLAHLLEETGAAKVNLIAHSMGGLDARYLVSALGMHAVVASVVTVSSPHHGSCIADLVKEQPERLQAWAAGFVNWMGTNSLEEGTSDVLTAVSELTAAHVCEVFNPAVPDHPDVRYWSYAGRAGKGTGVPLNPVLLLNNTVLHAREGENDGFVSVESAKWGTYLGTIDADHTQQVGLRYTPRSDFDSNDFYLSVVKRLAKEGL